MNRAIILTATLALATTMAAQTVPPPPPPQAQPATPAAPATPAIPAPAPRARGHVYRVTTVGESGSYLGVDVRNVDSDRAKELKLKSDQGVEITMVDQDGPAGKAGLQEHDVVVSFNGQNVQSAEQLRRMIRETKPGSAVPLGIVRDGQPQTLQVTLADRGKLYSHAMPPMAPMPPIRVRIPDVEVPSFVFSKSSRQTGAAVENLTRQLGDYFGVKDGEGVLVRSVDKGSKAEAAGLRAGDVIVRVDNERVSGPMEWSRLLRNHEAGTVKLGILRDRREQTLTMTVPEQTSDTSWNSFTGPDMEQLRMQLERLGPELGQQQAEIQARIAKEMAAHQKEIQKAMRDAQREIERSMREMQKERAKAKSDDDEQ
ncbi:MAG: PDZ domain-containing protein [Terriglobales bacterium]